MLLILAEGFQSQFLGIDKQSNSGQLTTCGRMQTQIPKKTERKREEGEGHRRVYMHIYTYNKFRHTHTRIIDMNTPINKYTVYICIMFYT